MTLRFLLLLLVCAALSGCAAHVVEVDIINQTDKPLRNIEVYFGGGSYGRSSISAGGTNHNRIKVFNLAPIQVQFDDASGKHVTANGPQLGKNAEGTVTLTVDAYGLTWSGHPKTN